MLSCWEALRYDEEAVCGHVVEMVFLVRGEIGDAFSSTAKWNNAGLESNGRRDSLVESLALELPSPNESIRGGPSTAEVMETDTDLLMPVPEESLLSGKVPRQCVRQVRARRTQPAGPGRNATDRGQEQCRSDDGGRAVVLGRRRGILREQSQNPIINAEYVIELEKIGTLRCPVQKCSTTRASTTTPALPRNVTSITKYGWKCRCCRVCFDWGSRTPGGDASSRWLQAAGQGLVVSNLSSSLLGGGPPGWLSAVCVTSIVQAPTHLLSKKLTQTPKSTPKSTPKPEEKIIPLALEGNHYVDGVGLSEHNLHQIKSLQTELASGNQSYSCNLSRHWTRTTEFWAVAGSNLDNSLDDVNLEPLATNGQDVVELRKKRQRNLQKLGIDVFLCGGVPSGPRTTKSGKNLRPRRLNRKTSQSEGTRRIRRYVLRQATVAVVFPCHRYIRQSCPPPL
ncbi:set domain protein [Culex quinquefasciatus]|uniref:Set domain protein n=1 Tax=Culex quinquefasciatus TaxID=7176 RepID=B0W2Z1_CULQU|nr:set domain protein [Culex quinquefasciatus]|eukprot:XP_001843075.1 set domain protein [Culex quinquefasciatus]